MDNSDNDHLQDNKVIEMPTMATETKKESPIDIMTPDCPNGGVLSHIRANKPKELETAIYMRGKGNTYRQIKAATGIDTNTLCEVFRQYPRQIQAVKDEVSAQTWTTIQLLEQAELKKVLKLLESEDELERTPLNQITTAKAINIDKGMILTGQATQIVETRQGLTTKQALDYMRNAKALKTKANAVDPEPS